MLNLSAREALRDLQRSKAKNSLFFFVKEILGYPDIVATPHQEMCSFFEDAALNVGGAQQSFSMLLVPRGCFKTTIGSVGFPLWMLKENHDSKNLDYISLS